MVFMAFSYDKTEDDFVYISVDVNVDLVISFSLA